MKYTLGCSCTMQQAFKHQLIRLIYERTTLENEEFLQNMDDFINLWCPKQNDCPCKNKED